MEPKNIEVGSSHYGARYSERTSWFSIFIVTVLILTSVAGITLAIALPLAHAHASMPVP